jgi:hypothetical protein
VTEKEKDKHEKRRDCCFNGCAAGGGNPADIRHDRFRAKVGPRVGDCCPPMVGVPRDPDETFPLFSILEGK